MIQETIVERPVVRTSVASFHSHRLGAHYRVLAERVQSALPETVVARTIGVMSCSPGAGASTVAINLALATAGEGFGPVLFVDTDVTRPTPRQLSRVTATFGLADALANEIDPLDCATNSPIENLSIIAGHGKSKYKNLIVEPHALADVLNPLKQHFKLLIVDIATTSQQNETSTLACQMDGVVLVIEAERERERTAVRMTQRLADVDANVLGVVLNKRRKHIPAWINRLL